MRSMRSMRLQGANAMKSLIDRIVEARDIAAEREPDIRIKEFLRAITIRRPPAAAMFST